MVTPSTLNSLTFRSGLFAVVVAVAACASTALSDPDPDGPGRNSCTLMLENHGFTDLHVFALVGNGSRVRLARINALEKRRIQLPASFVGVRNMRLEAVPTVVGAAYTSESVPLEGGTEVVWQLKNNLRLSALFVR